MWFSEAAHVCASLPIELEHEAGDSHASRDLEGHASDKVHAVSRVWMESRVIKLLCVVELLLGGTWRNGPRPENHQQDKITSDTVKLTSCRFYGSMWDSTLPVLKELGGHPRACPTLSLHGCPHYGYK